MNETQILGIVLATAPTVLAVLLGILINNSRLSDTNRRIDDINARIGDLRIQIDGRFNDVDRRFVEADRKIDQRFDDMKETWPAELHRVEEVLDARLKHLEER